MAIIATAPCPSHEQSELDAVIGTVGIGQEWMTTSMSGKAGTGGTELSSIAADASPFDKTYKGVMRGLYDGSFVPGQRLIAPDLMRRFGVGRGTIREVLHRLASAGVVSIVPNRGAQIRQLTRREVCDVLDVVEVLLGLAARGAAGAIAEPSLQMNVPVKPLLDANFPKAIVWSWLAVTL